MKKPLDKIQKQRSYNRYKMLYKAKRKHKAEAEKQSQAAEKELKRRLRITPLKTYEEGKNSRYVRYNGNPISFDEDGNLVDQVTGETGTMMVPDITVQPSIEYQAQQAYNNERDLQYKIWLENRPTTSETPYRGIPLQSVYPEFDLLLSLGGIIKGTLNHAVKRNLSKRFVDYKHFNPKDVVVDDLITQYKDIAAKRNAEHVIWDMDYTNPNWIAEGGVHYTQIPTEIEKNINSQIISRYIEGQRKGATADQIKALDSYLKKSYKDGGYDVYPKELFDQAGMKGIKGVYEAESDRIAITQGNEDVLFHELRHRLDNHAPLTREQQGYVDAAYKEFNDLLKQTHINGSDYDYIPEIVTTNAEARNKTLQLAGLQKAPLDQQNKYIDLLSDDDVFTNVYYANNYGRNYIEQLADANKLTPKLANALRNAFKYVPAFSIPITINNVENKRYKSGKNSVIYPMLTDSNYDQIRAIELGYKQDLNDHYPTRDYITGDILKHPMHPTFIKGLIEDAKLGYYPSIKHKPGRSNTQTWKGNDYINNKFNFYQ